MSTVMNRYQPYPKYKASGVEWLGDVPEHWKVKKLKFNLQLKTQKVLIENQTVIALENIESGSGKHVPTESAYQGEDVAFEVGDVLFGKLRPYLAKVFLTKSDGVAFGDLLTYQAKSSFSSHFGFYSMLSRSFIDIVDSSTYGTKMPRASAEFIAEMPLTTPPLAEQTTIANFLDTQTAKIDTLIVKQQRMIALLGEKRQAVISHAVTKGLNPDTPMKDSGVEWLGDVPEHWGVHKLKYAVDRIGDVDHYMPKTVSSGKPYMMTGDMAEKASLIDFSSCKQISDEDFIQLSQKIKPSIGDVIFARYATIGTVCYVDVEEDFIVSYSCVTIKPNHQKILGKYLIYFFKSSFFMENIKSSINSNTQGNVGIDSLYSTTLILPSVDEQNSVILFVEEKTAKIDTLISKANQAIALMKERRSAIISAAVTGQIDVRAVV